MLGGKLEISLEHLLRLTDNTGIIQHAKYHLPDRSTGYTIDDNVRAMMAMAKLYRHSGDREALRLAEHYLGFVHYARLADGRFHNCMDYDRRFTDAVGSEDSLGRTVWALGTVSAMLAEEGAGRLGKELFLAALPYTADLGSPRAWAFCLLGLYEYLRLFPERRPLAIAAGLADRLTDLYKRTATDDWPWFEDRLTYCNAIMPAAVFAAYRLLGEEEALNIAEDSLGFITETQWQNGCFRLIGCHGWYVRGGDRAWWDEQPVDAAGLIIAYGHAYRATGDSRYISHAEAAMDWFYGRNIHSLPLYDRSTGGCCDGLTVEGVNENQGAESILSYALGRLEIAALAEPAQSWDELIAEPRAGFMQ